MRFIIALIAILWMPLAIARGDQNHECQGGFNCNDNGGGDTDATAISGAISGSTSGAVATGGDSISGVGDTTANAGDSESNSAANADVVNNVSLFGNSGSEGGSGGVDGQSAPGGGPLLTNTTTTVTTSNKYKEAPRAYAGLASFPKDIDCRIVLGFDFRGATEDGSGGATFGIPLPERKDCKFERQAARAFAKGDLERGWANHCRSPTNIESTIWVARAVQGEDIDVDGAFKRCMRNATVEDPEPPKT